MNDSKEVVIVTSPVFDQNNPQQSIQAIALALEAGMPVDNDTRYFAGGNAAKLLADDGEYDMLDVLTLWRGGRRQAALIRMVQLLVPPDAGVSNSNNPFAQFAGGPQPQPNNNGGATQQMQPQPQQPINNGNTGTGKKANRSRPQ